MCKCSATPKACLAFLSLIFWGVAGGLLFIGAWIFHHVKNLDEISSGKYTLVPAAILMACGIFLFLLGVIGCVGAFKEQKCLLALFFSVLLLIFVGLVSGAALSYVYRQQVDTNVKDGIWNGLHSYHNDSLFAKQIDLMQETFKCCGNSSFADWKETQWYRNQNDSKVQYPESCCVNEKCNYSLPPQNNTQLYQHGCYQSMRDSFFKNLGIILGVGVAFAIVQVLGMVCSCVLICRRKSEVPYIGLNEPTGMRV